MSDLDEERKYEDKLFKEIEHIKFSLRWYIGENARLKNELEYYKNVYENRVDEYIKLSNRVGE